MGRELQKKKRRSKRQPVRQPNKTKKILNPRGNNIIAQNWNKNETLAQNYRRLGLLARLKAPAGGTEKKLATSTSASTVNPTLAISKHDPFAISNLDKAIISEAKVERDADGKIIRILSRSHIEKANPLNDPLRALDSDSDSEDADGDGDGDADAEYPAWGGLAEKEAAEDANTTDIVRSLIEESHNPAPKMKRYQSEAEREWLQRLVDRHGDDTGAMARDLKLNPMQQTARDIAKRLRKMQEA
ncbi:hypothetical protein E4U13_003786 [Claviceps humidiphila]|uniref:Nucleolar protein 16 n=1 Tax=Claviceps humidiphila TaxID=1294629 RepID=A0A9P7TTN4_9HYPO|nr:hypothetical protein E4U13_003786 [Claviceps humidiphila]